MLHHLITAAGVALALTACGGTISDGPNSASTEILVEDATISRCNQLIEYGAFSFTLTVTNTGTQPLVLGGISLAAAEASGATLVDGDTAFAAPVLLPAGQSARFACAPDVGYGWSASGAEVALNVVVALSYEDGATAGTASGAGAIRFMDAWDNCNTFVSQPHPCEPLPFN